MRKALKLLNDSQQNSYDTIIQKIDKILEDAHFFLQGPAGTGKTFLYQTLWNYFRGQKRIVTCVASSGITALYFQVALLNILNQDSLDVHQWSICDIKTPVWEGSFNRQLSPSGMKFIRSTNIDLRRTRRRSSFGTIRFQLHNPLLRRRLKKKNRSSETQLRFGGASPAGLRLARNCRENSTLPFTQYS